MKISLSVTTLLCCCFSFCIGAEVIQYPPVASNVAYANVMALAYKEPDERISYGEDPLQFGDLWLPVAGKNTQNKLLIFIHGGCWLNAYDIKHSYALATALAQEGYAVWSLEYRRTGDTGGGWPGTFEDIVTAISRSSQLRNAEYSLNNTLLMGHSAGGHLSLLAGSQHAELRGIIGLAAITDIVSYAAGKNSCQQATAQFMAGMPADQPQQYQDANPVTHKVHGNTVLFQGNADNIVATEQAMVLGVPVIHNTAAGHFDWIHPGTSAYKQLLNEIHSTFTR